LSKEQSPKTAQDKPYRESIGSANFSSLTTHPDTSYVVSVLSRYLDSPGLDHWAAVQHLFAYLNGTVNYELTYGTAEHPLLGYTDADSSMHKDRRAISGYAFLVNGGAVSWSSK